MNVTFHVVKNVQYVFRCCDIVGHFNDSLFETLMYKKQASLLIQKPNKEKNILEGNVNYTLGTRV